MTYLPNYLLNILKLFTIPLAVMTVISLPGYALSQTGDTIPPDLQNGLSEIEQIYMNKDAEGRAEGFVEDGVHITGWGQTVKGKQAIRQLYKETFAQFDEISNIEVTVDHMTFIDDHAALRGRFVWEAETADGEDFNREIHIAALLRKVDNQWKIVWDLTGSGVNEEGRN